MQKIILILLAFTAVSCGPGYVALKEQKESVVTLPIKVDTGDRFADPNLPEQEKATNIDPSINESLIDSKQDHSGSPEARLSRLNQRMLNNAEYVVKKERNKAGIGDACNFFLQRILELSGFSDDGYIANTFDQYAKKHFTGAKTAQFKVEPLRKDAINLEKFLFSYPEGTPFILNWQKAVGHGHLAIVTRKDNKLIIYEASLGRFKAEKKLTTVRYILSASERYKMTVYVNFMPNDK